MRAATQMQSVWKPKVLIVEDNPTDAVAPLVLIEQLGLEPMLAVNGEQAVELMRKFKFDLIILDWNLENMSGLEVLLEGSEKTKLSRGLTKVIVHSSLNLDLDDWARGNNYSIVDYWKKPFNVVEMAKRMKWLENLGGRL